MGFGALSFLSPWLLSALLVLPGLWWLLRVTPPQPRVVRFPAFFLLRGLKSSHKSPAKTPWWLLALRCLLAALFIFAMAEPVSRLQQAIPGETSPVIVAVDNGWAAAVNWDKRQDRIRQTLQQLAREKRSVLLLPTAAAPDRAEPALSGPMTAEEALVAVDGLMPRSWPADHAAAGRAVQAAKVASSGHAVFFSDGSSRSALDTQSLVETLIVAAGSLQIVTDDTVNRPVLLRRVSDTPGEMSFEIERLKPQAQAAPMMLVALGDNGALIDELRFSFPAGEKTYRVEWPMNEDLRVKVARIAVRDLEMASAVYLTDTQWRQRPVGIIADMAQKDSASFLNEVYYLRRALETDSTLAVDDIQALLKQDRSVLIWPDSAPLGGADRAAILQWVEEGGFLIRFAGPALAANPDDALLPVTLRQGQRALEGSMTWEKPARLAPIADSSPFFGLQIPEDVTVTRQVLASPEPETFARTWMQLADGTPLITGGAVGQGSIALIHTTAGADWSNFCYSGLYVDVLRRMVALSRGVTDYKGSLLLPPLLVMDGFGHLQAPATGSLAAPIDARADFEPSPRTPPGIYGDHQQFHVYTLGGSLSGLYPLPSLPHGIDYATYAPQGETSHTANLLKLAILLLLADLIATLTLRGVIAWPFRARAAVGMILAFLVLASPAQAQEVTDAMRASHIYLAYVETGDPAIDAVSHNGLAALGRVVSARTSIRVQGVVGVDPEIDQLYAYSFLYWPMTAAQRPLSLTAAQNVQNYLSHGGMVVFDTRDGQFGDVDGETLGTRRLRELTQSLAIPALMPVGKGHILGKSFYLLEDFPGAYAGGQVWVEKEPNANYDAVTSIVIGGNDWAAAWSEDTGDRARHAVTPGGERQREMANRFGVNLVMVTLAGNYKADQLHVPFILERMGQ